MLFMYVVDIIETIQKVPGQGKEADESGRAECEVGWCLKYISQIIEL